MHVRLKPNILFLLIDGLRADKCHGNKKTSVTPCIDSLIENSVYFNQAICSVPLLRRSEVIGGEASYLGKLTSCQSGLTSLNSSFEINII